MKILNLTNPAALSWKDLITWLSKQNITIFSKPIKTWLEEDLTTITPNNPLYPLLSLYLDNKNSHRLAGPDLDLSLNTSETTHILKKLSLEYPQITEKLLEHWFLSYLKNLLPRHQNG